MMLIGNANAIIISNYFDFDLTHQWRKTAENEYIDTYFSYPPKIMLHL